MEAVTANGDAAMVSVIDGVEAVCGAGEVESVALITRPEVVPVVGVPVMVQALAFKAAHAGSIPEVRVQV